ncbi:MAG: glutamine-hydrolyzing GMP synthase, partial [Candidatus Jacksonbacteria bacterium]
TCLIGSPPKRRNSKLFHGLPDKLTVWMSHGDSVVKLPPGFDVLAKTSDCPIAAMGNLAKNIYGLQFHPEVHHTKDKDKILYNFAVKICKARQDWKIDDLLTEIIKDIKKQAKNKKVFMLVSGGVDSSVAFALLEKSLGKKNVIGLHIDSGLMRKNESAKVKQNLAPQACGAGFDDLNVADASETFLTRLHGISDPEQKRKIIGEAYLDAAEQWFKKRGDREGFLLGQGTIYPDTIETGGTKHADTIKTHHNRIDRIQKMIKQGKIIEPLKNFYKDEVRAIGRKLGLPNRLLNRHPFPGPGLGIRILCSSYRDAIYRVPKITANFPHQILPIKSVGVQGDCRTYAHPIAVWGINNWDKLEKISTNLTNKHQKINRVIKVCWVRTKGKPKFKCKPNACLTKERLDLLREINDIVEQEIRKNNIYDKIWQFPVVLAPLTLSGGESVILRPIESREAMTANFYKMDHKILTQIVRQISQFTEIDAIFYDVTNKPPSTIEWE